MTLGRALELGHKPAVVSALAAETGQQFTLAGDALKTLDPAQFNKWATYLTLKAAFYESYVSALDGKLVMIYSLFCQTYCFFGKELLVQEKCGDSIKALQHSQACKRSYD